VKGIRFLTRQMSAAIAIVLAAGILGEAQAASLTAQEAARHIGETATVCGTVAFAKYSARSRRQPTFLDLDRPYPNHIFTVLIWGENRSKFGSPETTLLGSRICATGMIESYKGKAEIIATDPHQISIQ